ncbi:MAG: hypothetical protein M1825_005214 [Sarcosagium campestre]|nr:MAG: hypothetical protein M1825_005214 [Sarcosagium campestre]
MHYSTLLVAAASAVSLGSAVALPAPQDVAVKGFFGDADPPPECSFLRKGYDFYYTQFKLAEGTACAGWTGFPTCKKWNQQEQSDLLDAVRQQVTKDGLTETSKVGKWTAEFLVLTSAFSDRDISPFELKIIVENGDSGNGNGGAGATTYFWNRKNNGLKVSREGGCD